MQIKKRNGSLADFDIKKIEIAISKAYDSVAKPRDEKKIAQIAKDVKEKAIRSFPKSHTVSVEEIQDLVEISLIEHNEYKVVRSYILYRQSHFIMRKTIEDFSIYIKNEEILDLIREIQNEFKEDSYNLMYLYNKFSPYANENKSDIELLDILIKTSSELTSKEEPSWEYISARFLSKKIDLLVREKENKYELVSFYKKLKFLTEKGLYGSYILENYNEDEINKLYQYIDFKRDKLFNFPGLDLLMKRYLLKNSDGELLERPGELFMGIAMHLAMKEKEKLKYAKDFYDILSKLKVTMATPTLSNARRPFHQLSSCFIDTVPDSLTGIYRSIDNFAQVSKHGGGMGLYFGKVRSMGSDIRGYKGVAGGVTRWIKLANDTAVAVDQLGVRQGACACYLDIWHKDIPEFLQLRTNNGDDRMKSHDIFPGICVPNIFWKLCEKIWTLIGRFLIHMKLKARWDFALKIIMERSLKKNT